MCVDQQMRLTATGFLTCQRKYILEKLEWEPTTKIRDGLRKTYFWIKEQIESEVKDGKDASAYSHSEVVQQVDDSLMMLGEEKK